MAALPPISLICSTNHSVITVMHITSALIHSNTALDLLCSLYKNKALVFLYIRIWIDQLGVTSQAFFLDVPVCLLGRSNAVNSNDSISILVFFCNSYFSTNHMAVYKCGWAGLCREVHPRHPSSPSPSLSYLLVDMYKGSLCSEEETS